MWSTIRSLKTNQTKQQHCYYRKKDIAHYYGKDIMWISVLIFSRGYELFITFILDIIQDQTKFLLMLKEGSFWENIIYWDQ